MSKGGKTTTTTENLADPWVRQRGMDLFGQTQQLAQNGFQAYGGPRFAGPNADWRAGAEQMRNAGMAAQSNLDYASGAVRDAMGRPVGNFLSGNINAYMNPYQSGVIDAAMGDLDRARQMQLQSDGANAVAAGAFGGDRHGLVEAETNRGFAETAADTAARLRAQGFDTASGLMMSDMDRDIAGRYATMQGAGMLPGLNSAMFDAAGQRMGLGREQMGQQQQQLDFNYQQFLEQQAHPWQMLAAQQGALGYIPQNTTNISTEKTQGSFLGGLGGLITAGASFIPGIGGGGAQLASGLTQPATKKPGLLPGGGGGGYINPYYTAPGFGG